MSTATRELLTVDEFLAHAGEREGKLELRDGLPVCMSPERLGHPCQAVPDSVGVRISPRSMFQPDALIYCGPRLS